MGLIGFRSVDRLELLERKPLEQARRVAPVERTQDRSANVTRGRDGREPRAPASGRV